MAQCLSIHFTLTVYLSYLQQCDTTAHIECPERRTVAIPNIGKDVGQWQLHSLLVGMQNGAATVEDTVTVPTSLNVLLP